MKQLDRFRKAFCDLPAGVVAAEVEAEKQDLLTLSLSDGRFFGAASSDVTELFVRVSGEKTGQLYTQDLTEDPAQLLSRALVNSCFSQAHAPEPMNNPASAGFFPNEATLSHHSTDALREKAIELENALITEAGLWSYSQIHLSDRLLSMGLVNSLGCDKTSHRRICEAQAILVREQQGQHAVCDIQLSATALEGLTPQLFLERCNHWLARRLPLQHCRAGAVRAVLDASVVCNILATVWQLFAAPYYLNNNTPLAGRLDQAVFAESVTIRDLPQTVGNGYTFAFDCEGSNSEAVTLVERGCLKALLHNLSSARKLCLPPTGNAGRKTLLSGSVHTQIAAIPKNFVLTPGTATQAELLLELGDGLYIDESYDVFHSINIASGDFNIPCQAIVVHKGQMTGRVTGLTLSGHVCDLFSGVLLVAADTQYQPMVLLKSYTVGAPSILIDRLQVNG